LPPGQAQCIPVAPSHIEQLPHLSLLTCLS